MISQLETARWLLKDLYIYGCYSSDEYLKRYKLSHLLLYFYGLHKLNQLPEDEWIGLTQFKTQIGEIEFDKKAVEDLLKDLETEEILKKRRNGNKFEYCLKENIFDKFARDELVQIYYLAELFAGKSLVHSAAAYFLRETIESFLMEENPLWQSSVFIIQHHFLQGILNEELMWKIEEAIHKEKQLRITTYRKNKNAKTMGQFRIF